MISEVQVQCPYCTEVFEEAVDTMEGRCDTIVDCPVCCRPIRLQLECRPGEAIVVETERG